MSKRRMRIDHIAGVAATPKSKSTEQLKEARRACTYWIGHEQLATDYWEKHSANAADAQSIRSGRMSVKDRSPPRDFAYWRNRIQAELLTRAFCGIEE